jgi:hypothetical protein
LSTPAISARFSSGVLTVLDGSTAVAHLNFKGSYSTSSFGLASDLHGGRSSSSSDERHCGQSGNRLVAATLTLAPDFACG